MSQQPTRPCPACGTSVPGEQRFCSNCGTDLTAAGPVSQYSGSQPQSYRPSQFAQSAPPYAQAPYGQYQQTPQKSSPLAEAFGALGLLFLLRRYRPGYRPRRQSSGCCGCLVLLLIFLFIFGIPGYIVARSNPRFLRQVQQNVGSTNPGSIPSVQPPITTAAINQTVNYAGVSTTIVSVQQSSAFLNDTDTATNGMIRVNLKEANNSSDSAEYLYSDIAHLILPNKSSIAPGGELYSIAPGANITRNNWLDFSVSSGTRIDQLTLVLGTNQETQISIPLTGRADLSAFQPRTSNPNLPIAYAGLNWTLQSATKTVCINGKQASAGMRYVILTFKIDNPTSEDVVIGFTQDYMRLKAGDTTNAPEDKTLPLYANAQTNGITGTVTFLMPANANSFTLIFLSMLNGSDPHSNTPVNTDFSIA